MQRSIAVCVLLSIFIVKNVQSIFDGLYIAKYNSIKYKNEIQLDCFIAM